MFEGEKQVKRLGSNPWRLPEIKKAIETEKAFPLQKLVHATHKEYYGPAIALFYAEGWSFIYFLNECDAVRKNGAWKSILGTYFATLKDAYADAIKGPGEKATEAEKERASEKARSAALDAAFRGVDLAALETEWKKFITQVR
jgi:hypothetical protein